MHIADAQARQLARRFLERVLREIDSMELQERYEGMVALPAGGTMQDEVTGQDFSVMMMLAFAEESSEDSELISRLRQIFAGL
jgi:hypothetical protein